MIDMGDQERVEPVDIYAELDRLAETIEPNTGGDYLAFLDEIRLRSAQATQNQRELGVAEEIIAAHVEDFPLLYPPAQEGIRKTIGRIFTTFLQGRFATPESTAEFNRAVLLRLQTAGTRLRQRGRIPPLPPGVEGYKLRGSRSTQ